MRYLPLFFHLAGVTRTVVEVLMILIVQRTCQKSENFSGTVLTDRLKVPVNPYRKRNVLALKV